MKKIIAAALACAALVGGSAASAEESTETNNSVITFSNELGSDVVNITKDKTTFAGFYDEVTADITSEKVDAGIDATLRLGVDEDGKPDSFSWSGDDFDWYLTFRPIQTVSLGFSTDFPAAGSYLAVEDDNIAGGKLGSDGFTAAFTGVPGLMLAATVPFSSDTDGGYNWFKHTETDDDGDETTTYLNFGFGAEYSFADKGTLAAVVHNPVNTDSFGYGVYGSLTPVEGLAVYGGYAYRDEDGICDVAGDNLFNASVSYTKDAFGCAADYVSTDTDFYTGVNVSYNVTETINVALGGTVNAEYDDASSGTYVLKPAVTYTPGEIGEFYAEADFSFVDEDFDSVCFPVYWKYSF
ncbi:MAG TPA: hypothetical protein DCL73_06370 [Treponema sp.]|nr:hypothetical protein [Treponema sp.]